jgi:hypothetical protein
MLSAKTFFFAGGHAHPEVLTLYWMKLGMFGLRIQLILDEVVHLIRACTTLFNEPSVWQNICKKPLHVQQPRQGRRLTGRRLRPVL